MVKMILLTGLIFSSVTGASQDNIQIDGGTSKPIRENKTYKFVCDPGLNYEISLTKNADKAIRLGNFLYGDKQVDDSGRVSVEQGLAKFMYIDSVSLRCTDGGARYLLGGAYREGQQRAALTVTISGNGRVVVEN